MIIVNYQYQKFSEVNHLNKNFIPNVNKLKLTVDVVSPAQAYKEIYPAVAAQFKHLFPNLKQHQCCNKNTIDAINSIDEHNNFILNVIHLMEHIIIDIQCTISHMKICSGVTCNYYEPSNRYDIFVECIDERVGYYAVQLVFDLVHNLLSNNRILPSYEINLEDRLIPVQFTHHDAFQLKNKNLHSYFKNTILNAENVIKN